MQELSQDVQDELQMKRPKREVGKRLFRYALHFKKQIIIALLLLSVAVAAELTGPFIAKNIIDTNILGIEKPWYEVAQEEGHVEYQGKWYVRSDRLPEGAAPIQEVRILQSGRSYYWIAEPIAFDGSRKIEGTQMVIEFGEEKASYPATHLSGAELYAFYKPEIQPILKWLGLYLFLLVFASFFQYGKTYLLQLSANRVIQKMRKDVFAHVQRLPIPYFDNLPAGKVVARITNDTEAIRELFVSVVATFFTSTMYLVGIFIALFILDAKLAMICMVIVPILVVWIIVYRYFASRYNHVIRTRNSDINAMVNESIQGMNIIQAFRRQKGTEQEFERINHEHFTFQNKLLNLNAISSHNLVNIFRNLAFVALIWYFGGASLGVGSVVSIGVLYAFVDYLNRLFHPVNEIVNRLAHLEQALVAADRVFELMDVEGKDVDTGEMARFQGHVVFDQVSFAYREEEYVLKNLSFEAKPGETIALVGHTGSGKSSIMNILFRFYDHQKGSITIDGTDIKDIPVQHMRKHIGIVLQDPFLFTGTIASNVSLNEPSITREQVEKALHDVGADRLLAQLPKGLDQEVIEKGSTLSAGERQLISFARALAYNPAILVLDEATANIDTETESIIQQALEVVKKGRTTFVIAHRLSTIKNADRILVLDHGRIVEMGNHELLMKQGGRYFQMYQLQQGKKAKQAV